MTYRLSACVVGTSIVSMKLFNKRFYTFFFGFLGVVSVTLVLIFVIGTRFS